MNNNDQRTYFLFLQLLILKKNEIFTITFLSGLKWMTEWHQLINKLTLYGYLRHSCINSNFHLIHTAPLLTLLYSSNIIILILVGHYLFAWIFFLHHLEHKQNFNQPVMFNIPSGICSHKIIFPQYQYPFNIKDDAYTTYKGSRYLSSYPWRIPFNGIFQ